MTEPHTGLSRRELLSAGAAVGGVAAVAGALGGGPEAIALSSVPQALGAALPGSTYLNIDAYGFFPDRAVDRIYQHITGSQPLTKGNRIWAPLPIPAGSIVTQISASYQGQPIIEISRRPLFSGVTATAPTQVFQQTLPDSPGGPLASTLAVPNLIIDQTATYTVSAFCLADASILGVSVGYLTGFVPFTGADPRVLDSRRMGGAIAADTERTVNMGILGRTAVFNLTTVNMTRAGFVSAYRADIAWPGNSSVNFSAPGQIVANLVICAMDANGAIKLRAGVANTDVVVDLIGAII